MTCAHGQIFLQKGRHGSAFFYACIAVMSMRHDFKLLYSESRRGKACFQAKKNFGEKTVSLLSGRGGLRMSRRDKRAAYAAAAKPETWLRQKTQKKGAETPFYCIIYSAFSASGAAAGRMVRTGTFDWVTTFSATEPNRILSMPLRPCVPMTMRSA